MTISIDQISKEDISRILSQQLDAELIDEEQEELDGWSKDYWDEDYDGLCLRDLSVQDIDELQVSRVSKFMDSVWDLSGDGHVVTQGSSLLNFEKARSPLIGKLLKCWTFYRLPSVSGNRVQTTYYNFRLYLAVANAIHEIGFFNESEFVAGTRTLESFTLEDRDELFRFLKQSGVTTGQLYKVGSLLENLFFQHMLSGDLPSEYSFPFDIFKGTSRLEVFPEPSQNTWMPIEPERLYPLAQTAIEVLDTVAQDMITIYQAFSLAEIKGAREGAKAGKRNAQVNYLKQKYIGQAVDPILEDFKFSKLFGGESWHELTVNANWVKKTNPTSKFNKRFIKYKGQFLVRAACAIVISLTLGLRSSELRGLKVGCCRPCEGKSDEFEIEVTVFKTARSKEGDLVTLPCPPITYKAVKVMEDLLIHQREAMGVDYLFVLATAPRTATPGPLGSGTLSNDLRYFADYVGVDYFHHHQFRKTIANFIVHQDPRNIDLVKRLFSHASITMSLRYIVHIPTIARDVHALLVKENVDIFTDLLASAAKGTVSGRQREYLIASTRGENSLFKGETEEELGRNILSYVETLMRNGTTLLRRAPINICVGEASPTQKCHCRKESEPAELQHLPNVANCQPYGCGGSIFTDQNEDELRIEVEFYEFLQSSPASSEAIKKDAQIKLAELHQILDDITLPLEEVIA